MTCQKTIKRSIQCSGIGLHKGRKVRLVLRPAAEDTGIVFALHGVDGVRFHSPTADAVVETTMATTLGFDGHRLATVEHLLAAVRGLEIDNLHVEVEGDEVPIMDGSSASFIFLLRAAGFRRQSKPRRILTLKKPIHFQQDGKWIKASPSDRLTVDYTINFSHPLVGTQKFFVDCNPENFTRDIAKARTFGFMREVEYLRRNGLALGGSLDNAVVLDEYGVINSDGLRFPDEFVRHKILDFIGDLFVLGMPMNGDFEVYCSGHALNNAFVRYLVDNRNEYLELDESGEQAMAEEAFFPSPVQAPATSQIWN
ncbi:UDP-3-O-acyl-N-acetylglucosamine deacetylase [Desulfonatronum parangueonense]